MGGGRMGVGWVLLDPPLTYGRKDGGRVVLVPPRDKRMRYRMLLFEVRGMDFIRPPLPLPRGEEGRGFLKKEPVSELELELLVEGTMYDLEVFGHSLG